MGVVEQLTGEVGVVGRHGALQLLAQEGEHLARWWRDGGEMAARWWWWGGGGGGAMVVVGRWWWGGGGGEMVGRSRAPVQGQG